MYSNKNMEELIKKLDLETKYSKKDRDKIITKYFKGKVRNNTIQLFSKQQNIVNFIDQLFGKNN